VLSVTSVDEIIFLALIQVNLYKVSGLSDLSSTFVDSDNVRLGKEFLILSLFKGLFILE
jgi:hypothetical protein